MHQASHLLAGADLEDIPAIYRRFPALPLPKGGETGQRLKSSATPERTPRRDYLRDDSLSSEYTLNRMALSNNGQSVI